MQRWWLRGVVALVVVAAVCSGAGGGKAEHTRAQDAPAISMINHTFTPSTITISAGTTVVWTNSEDPNGTDVTHDVVAGDGVSWYSDYLAPGDTYSRTFNDPGSYDYLCDIHLGMVGTILVQ